MSPLELINAYVQNYGSFFEQCKRSSLRVSSVNNVRKRIDIVLVWTAVDAHVCNPERTHLDTAAVPVNGLESVLMCSKSKDSIVPK